MLLCRKQVAFYPLLQIIISVPKISSPSRIFDHFAAQALCHVYDFIGSAYELELWVIVTPCSKGGSGATLPSILTCCWVLAGWLLYQMLAAA
jgi:hypothetical protein